MTVQKTTTSATLIEGLRGRQSYLTSTEVMAILRITRQTLCGWVRCGTISAVRIGKDNMFDPVALAMEGYKAHLTKRSVVEAMLIEGEGVVTPAESLKR